MRIEIDETTGCWNWTGSVGQNGYGYVAHPTFVTEPAHRASYRLFVGRLKKGMEIDHLCKNRRCVNPAHLEQVTGKENQRRSDGTGGVNFRKTHCIRGHAFDEENTYVTPRGDRQCRKCRNEAEKIGRVKRLERARLARIDGG
jgi:hypothetical protein